MPREVVGQLKGTEGHYDIEWEIEDFPSLPKEVDKEFCSPVYFFHDTSWYLKLYPNGQKRFSSQGHIGLYLSKEASNPSVCMNFSMSLKTTGGREVVLKESEVTFGKEHHEWGEPTAIKRWRLFEQEMEFLPSGVLTVICSIKCEETKVVKTDEVLRRAVKDCITSTDASTETEPDVGTKKLLSDLKDLVVSGDGSDVTVRVQGEEFRLHRAIVAARTPVFSSMFTHDMKEKTTGVVSIDDCDAVPFRTFVRYLYTGSTEELTTENMISLYKIADKYQVEELKTSCLDLMKSTLSVANFYDVVDLALKHGEEDLMERATDFLSENVLDIIGTKKWRTLLKNNMVEVDELLKEALVRKEKK